MPIISQDAGFRAGLATKAPLTITQGTIAYASEITLDFATLNGTQQTIALDGPLTLRTTNLAPGRNVEVRLIAGAALRALALPPGWTVMGTRPTSIQLGRTAMLRLTSFGTTNLGVVASYEVGITGQEINVAIFIGAGIL